MDEQQVARGQRADEGGVEPLGSPGGQYLGAESRLVDDLRDPTLVAACDAHVVGAHDVAGSCEQPGMVEADRTQLPQQVVEQDVAARRYAAISGSTSSPPEEVVGGAGIRAWTGTDPQRLDAPRVGPADRAATCRSVAVRQGENESPGRTSDPELPDEVRRRDEQRGQRPLPDDDGVHELDRHVAAMVRPAGGDAPHGRSGGEAAGQGERRRRPGMRRDPRGGWGNRLFGPRACLDGHCRCTSDPDSGVTIDRSDSSVAYRRPVPGARRASARPRVRRCGPSRTRRARGPRSRRDVALSVTAEQRQGDLAANPFDADDAHVVHGVADLDDLTGNPEAHAASPSSDAPAVGSAGERPAP